MWMLLLPVGIIFWAILGAICLFSMFALAIEDDDYNSAGVWAVTLIVIAFSGAVLFTNAFQSMSLWGLAALVIAYCSMGVLWSFKKWIDYIQGKKEQAKKIHTDDTRYKQARPLASDNKQRITTWMATWPLTFSWWVLTYPRHFFNWAYRQISATLDGISNKIWNS